MENRTIEIVEQQRENQQEKKKEQSLRELDYKKRSNIHVIGVPEGETSMWGAIYYGVPIWKT